MDSVWSHVTQTCFSQHRLIGFIPFSQHLLEKNTQCHTTNHPPRNKGTVKILLNLPLPSFAPKWGLRTYPSGFSWRKLCQNKFLHTDILFGVVKCPYVNDMVWDLFSIRCLPLTTCSNFSPLVSNHGGKETNSSATGIGTFLGVTGLDQMLNYTQWLWMLELL